MATRRMENRAIRKRLHEIVIAERWFYFFEWKRYLLDYESAYSYSVSVNYVGMLFF